MPLKLAWLLLLGAVACSDDSAPVTVAPPENVSEETPEVAPPAEAPPAEAPPSETVQLEPERIRVVLATPESILRSEQRLVDDVFAALGDAEVAREAATPLEAEAARGLIEGREWEAPPSWATHGVVLALAIDEPMMIGRREPRPYSRGLRGAFILRAGDDEPAFVQRSSLEHGSAGTGSNLEHLEVRDSTGTFLARLALLARSSS